MDYQFHQVVVFILTAIYIPMIMANTILMIKEKGWRYHLCYGIIAMGLIANLPSVIKNYQQYLMGHFSGLPEVISENQLIADSVVTCVFMMVVISFTYFFIVYRK